MAVYQLKGVEMADRICSCCDQGYSDDERHDYEECYRRCETRVDLARHNLNHAWDCLEMAEGRRIAQREGRIK